MPRSRWFREPRVRPRPALAVDPQALLPRCEFPPLSRTVNPVTSTVSIQARTDRARAQRNSMTRHAGSRNVWYRKFGRETGGAVDPVVRLPTGTRPGRCSDLFTPETPHRPSLNPINPSTRGSLPRALGRTLSPRFMGPHAGGVTGPVAGRRSTVLKTAPSHRPQRRAELRAANARSSSERRCAGLVRVVLRLVRHWPGPAYLNSSS